jgi:hypothetical protein
MHKRIVALLGIALLILPALSTTAQAKGGCKVVYCGNVGGCEPETGPSNGGGGGNGEGQSQTAPPGG